MEKKKIKLKFKLPTGIKSLFVNYLRSFSPPIKSSIGLDIGSDSIKLIEVAQKNEAFELINYGIRNISGATKDEIVSSEIKSLFQDTKPSTNVVNISVSGQSVLVRYIQMPKMTEKEKQAGTRKANSWHLNPSAKAERPQNSTSGEERTLYWTSLHALFVIRSEGYSKYGVNEY